MRPRLFAAAAALAVLAFLVWPTGDVALETNSVEASPASSAAPAGASSLLAVGLAAASLAVFLQGFRPRSKAVARALGTVDEP